MRRSARYLSLLAPVAVVLAMSKVHAAWVADPPYDFTDSSRFAWAIGYLVVLVIAAYGAGLPELPRSLRQGAAAAVGALVGAALAVSAVQLLVGDALLPRFVVLGSALILVPVHVGINSLARSGRSRDEDRDRVVLVASDDERDRLLVDLDLAPEQPAGLVAHLVPRAAVGQGDARPLVEIVLAERASVIVLDRSAQADPEVVVQAAGLHEAGIRVRTLVQFYEEWLGKLPVAELERASLFFDIGEIHRARYARIKRLIDLGIGLVGLIPFALSVPLVALADLVANRGPLFYRQPRVGRDGEVFQILKYRSMLPTAPGEPAQPSNWTAVDDPRVTSFGRVLRASHLDELPQVLNIVKGELSVVGPRPEQPRYVAELSATLPFYGMRHLVRPGLTGWAQVKYGYAGDEDDALEKLQYEFFYLRHQGLRFDLRVMGRTVRSVLGSEGRGR
ncbi:MAG: sugar transferase [Acidimicrobiales bacterium]|nr:sugar transferase [Acidimicrobiales bacterium]HRW37189.1 sugar transferase [Aquihabitans sp.]